MKTDKTEARTGMPARVPGPAAGDGADAVRQLAAGAVSLAMSVAGEYRCYGAPRADLVRWGTAGLVLAAGKYDAGLGFRFADYAVWWVRQAVLRGLGEGGFLDAAPVGAVEAAGSGDMPAAVPEPMAPAIRDVSDSDGGGGVELSSERLRRDMERAFRCIKEREEDILRGFLGLGSGRRSFDESGWRWGIPRRRVISLYGFAVKRLKRLRDAAACEEV